MSESVAARSADRASCARSGLTRRERRLHTHPDGTVPPHPDKSLHRLTAAGQHRRAASPCSVAADFHHHPTRARWFQPAVAGHCSVGARVRSGDPGCVRAPFCPAKAGARTTRPIRAARGHGLRHGARFLRLWPGRTALAHTPDHPTAPEPLRSVGLQRLAETSVPWWGGGGARRRVHSCTVSRLEGFPHPQSADATTWLGGLRWGALGVSASADRRGPGRNKRAPCLSPWPRAARIGRVVRAPA